MNTLRTMHQENEQLIQINVANEVVGSVGKITAHQGQGVLHRALTAFLFDDAGRILVTKRSTSKPLWPEYWDAACSSHQWYPAETAVEAATRRIPFELGITLDSTAGLEELFSYEYHAVYSLEWSENEINSIVVGTFTGECQLNEKEVAEFEWLTPSEVVAKLNAGPPLFAPWFRLAWDGLLERNRIILPL